MRSEDQLYFGAAVNNPLALTTDGKPLEIDWTADATLVAGAVIRYADILVDASVKGKLARLKQQLI